MSTPTPQQEDQYEQAQAQHRAAASRAHYYNLLEKVHTALTWFTQPAHRLPVRQYMRLDPFLPPPDRNAGPETQRAYRLNQTNFEIVHDADRQLRQVMGELTAGAARHDPGAAEALQQAHELRRRADTFLLSPQELRSQTLRSAVEPRGRPSGLQLQRRQSSLLQHMESADVERPEPADADRHLSPGHGRSGYRRGFLYFGQSYL